jgi:subtilisin family serine protease
MDRTLAIWEELGLPSGRRGLGVKIAVVDDAIDSSHSSLKLCCTERLNFAPHVKVAFELYGLCDTRQFQAYCNALRRAPRKEAYYRLLAAAVNELVGYDRFPPYETSMVESYGSFYAAQLALEYWKRVEGCRDEQTGRVDLAAVFSRAGLEHVVAGDGRKVWFRRSAAGAVLSNPSRFDHGTHVAAIACGAQEVGGSYTGVAPNATLLALEVGTDILGRSALEYVDDALAYAMHAKADVVNLSLGSPSPDRYTQPRIRELVAAGVLVVAATGNSQAHEGALTAARICYPARNDGVISVGAADTTSADGLVSRAFFSEIGDNLEFLAPGVRVSSAKAGTAADAALKSGTSMAAPYVAGVAALLLSLCNLPPGPARARAVSWALASHCQGTGSSRDKDQSAPFNHREGYGCVLRKCTAARVVEAMSSVPESFRVD